MEKEKKIFEYALDCTRSVEYHALKRELLDPFNHMSSGTPLLDGSA
jgi:hypothetical protein